MKGIILAGGSGTRLSPLTVSVNKQLLPVFDKPIIYYPLSVLMLLGIKEILIICSPDGLPQFKKLLRTGEQWGIKLSYCIQEKPSGLPEAFILGEEFIGDESVCLILGDNIFFGHDLLKTIYPGNHEHFAYIFGYEVSDPERYGVVEFDNYWMIRSLEEKPKKPKSKYAIPGLYFFPNKEVSQIAKTLTPSARGETEILDLLKVYLAKKHLLLGIIGRGIAWLDVGTHEALLDAGNFIASIQKRQGTMVACLEEIAHKKEYITTEELKKTVEDMPKNNYSEYLIKYIEGIDGHR